MKILAILLLACGISASCLATSIEYRSVKELYDRSIRLQVLLKEIQNDHHGDLTFCEALSTTQKKWDDYCTSMLDLRFPDQKKRSQRGSAYDSAYYTAWRALLDARLKDLEALARADTKPKKEPKP